MEEPRLKTKMAWAGTRKRDSDAVAEAKATAKRKLKPKTRAVLLPQPLNTKSLGEVTELVRINPDIRKNGRPPKAPHVVTLTTRARVTALVATGVSRRVIAEMVKVNLKEITTLYAQELANGKEIANGEVGAKFYDAALAGNVTAQMFWLKTRAGFTEAPTSDGGVQEQITQQLKSAAEQLSEKLNRMAGEADE